MIFKKKNTDHGLILQCPKILWQEKRKKKKKKEKKWKMKNESGADQPQLNLTAVCYIATFSLLLFVVCTLAWPQ